MELLYTYVLQSSKDKKYYIGYTRNLRNRLEEHKKGVNTSTKPRRPLGLIYFEACLDESDAKQREKYLKNTIGRRYLARRLHYYQSRVTG